MSSRWQRIKKQLKDWDVDIVLITLVVLCLLLNAISMVTANGDVKQPKKITTGLLPVYKDIITQNKVE